MGGVQLQLRGRTAGEDAHRQRRGANGMGDTRMEPARKKRGRLVGLGRKAAGRGQQKHRAAQTAGHCLDFAAAECAPRRQQEARLALAGRELPVRLPPREPAGGR
jgi:hypothetical protein